MGIHQVVPSGGSSFRVSPSATIINEGDTVIYTVLTNNVNNGTVLYWTTSGVNANRFQDGVTQGTVTITGNTGTISRTVIKNYAVDGLTSFNLTVRTNSYIGSIVASSPAVHINDTSLARPHGSIEYMTASVIQWVVPTGVELINAVVVGGGGGGGGGSVHPGKDGSPGGGGGSGYVSTLAFSVTAGDVLTITVGAGGIGGINGVYTTGATGGTGGTSIITRNAVTILSAAGGNGGGGGTHWGGGIWGTSGGGAAFGGTGRYNGSASGAGNGVRTTAYQSGNGAGVGGHAIFNYSGGPGLNGYVGALEGNDYSVYGWVQHQGAGGGGYRGSAGGSIGGTGGGGGGGSLTGSGNLPGFSGGVGYVSLSW